MTGVGRLLLSLMLIIELATRGGKKNPFHLPGERQENMASKFIVIVLKDDLDYFIFTIIRWHSLNQNSSPVHYYHKSLKKVDDCS